MVGRQKIYIESADIFAYNLIFKKTAITSRDSLKNKWCFFLLLKSNHGAVSIGEIAPIVGLSLECPTADSLQAIEEVLQKVTKKLANCREDVDSLLKLDIPLKFAVSQYPSIAFGLEMAIYDLANGGKRIFFNNDFSKGKASIAINGLIWMGKPTLMQRDADILLEKGFSCIKLKVSQPSLRQELEIVKHMRKRSPLLQIRLDANGSFGYRLENKNKIVATNSNKIDALKNAFNFFATLGVHSVEQPLPPSFTQAQQNTVLAKIWQTNLDLIANSPTPIAFDEELIPIRSLKEKKRFFQEISKAFSENRMMSRQKSFSRKLKHQSSACYIVVKPSLVGGFSVAEEWIKLAHSHGIRWWITSALESNFGLAAIAQFAYEMLLKFPPKEQIQQGLGTGSLYKNNIASPLHLANQELFVSKENVFDKETAWRNPLKLMSNGQ